MSKPKFPLNRYIGIIKTSIEEFAVVIDARSHREAKEKIYDEYSDLPIKQVVIKNLSEYETYENGMCDLIDV